MGLKETGAVLCVSAAFTLAGCNTFGGFKGIGNNTGSKTPEIVDYCKDAGIVVVFPKTGSSTPSPISGMFPFVAFDKANRPVYIYTPYSPNDRLSNLLDSIRGQGTNAVDAIQRCIQQATGITSSPACADAKILAFRGPRQEPPAAYDMHYHGNY